MIGNDIVDLHLSKTESNWQRKGWVNKLFCEEEQQHIKSSETPEILIWLYWSMKEAAYKIYNRQTGKRKFSPAKLHCTIRSMNNSTANGFVVFEAKNYHTESRITDGFIHTIAGVNHKTRPSNIIIGNNKNALTPCPHLILCKDELNLPYILNKATGKTFTASKSHHGAMEAIVF